MDIVSQELASPRLLAKLAPGLSFQVKVAAQDSARPMLLGKLTEVPSFSVRVASKDLTSPVLLRELAGGTLVLDSRRHLFSNESWPWHLGRRQE